MSLRQALVQLGYKDCYHFASTLQENPRDAEMWVEAMNAKFKGIGKPYGKEQFDALLGHCQAVTDNPCVIFYKELLAAYPDAKVILTERDNVDQWHRSSLTTLVHYAKQMIPETWFARFLMLRFSPADPKVLELTECIAKDTPIFAALWRDYHDGTETAKQMYKDYNAEIKRLVPRENLLAFNVKEGWVPVCEFLNEQVPETEFPSRNSKNDFARNNEMAGQVMQSVALKNMALFGAGVVAVLAAATFAVLKRR